METAETNKRIQMPLNQEMAQAIFDKNAVMIEQNDVIPMSTAIELFGEDTAVSIWRKRETGRYINVFSLPSGEYLHYFYKAGFWALVTHHNVKEIWAKEK